MRRRLMMIALIAFAAALLPVTASAGVEGLSVAPAHPDAANPATRAYFIHTVSPGGTFADQVKVTNAGAKPLEVLVSPVDGLTGATSGAVYADRQDPLAKAGAWVAPAHSSLTLPPGMTTYLDFTVRVPADASPGDHLAGIAFEDAHPSSNGTGFQVTTVLRAVVGVLVKVPGAASFHLAVSSALVEPLTDALNLATVRIGLKDDGLLLGKPRLTVRLTGPTGYHDVVADRQLDTLLPGDLIQYPFPWPDALAPGDYTVDITAVGSGMTEPATFSMTAHVAAALQPTKTEATPPPPSVATAPAPGFVVGPRALAAGIAGLSVVLVSMLVVIFRLARRTRAQSSQETTVRIEGSHRSGR